VKTALITGAGSGIGQACAIALARAGYAVALVGRRASALRATARLCDGAPNVMILSHDVSKIELAPQLVRDVVVGLCSKVSGPLDVLVNAAGVAPSLPVERTSAKVLRQTFDTNALGPAALIAAAWPALRRSAQKGSMPTIINVSSLAVIDPFDGFFAYAASKAALSLMTLSAAKQYDKALACPQECQPAIAAIALAPGMVDTPMLQRLLRTTQSRTQSHPDREPLRPAQSLPASSVAHAMMLALGSERRNWNGKTVLLVPQDQQARLNQWLSGQTTSQWFVKGPVG
jgi:NAD(P)-dependent dehydrogenase (short-subunit alcohol dehydrogenase family)